MNRGLLDSPVTPNIGGNAAGSVVIDVASDRDEQALWEEMAESDNEGSPQNSRPHAVKFIQRNLSKFSRRAVNAAPMPGSPSEVSAGSPRGDVELLSRSEILDNKNWNELDSEEDRVSRVKDLDAFFSDVYFFFYEKGFVTIVAKSIVNVITLGFMVAFSTFLLAYLDWSELMKCTSRETCKQFNHYVHYSLKNSDAVWQYCVVGYVILSSLYWVWNVCSAITAVFRATRMSAFFRDELKIETKELQTMEWDAVVGKLIPVMRNQMLNKRAAQQLSAHVIASRIMRKDNYIIAFVNRGVLNLTVPAPFISKKMMISKYMEYYIRALLVNSMFDEDTFDIRDEFLRTPGALRSRFFWTGVLLLFLSPFILLFMLLDFFMRNAQEWHSKKNYLGPRRYSAYAQWTFREFNELPHVLERRLAQSYEHGHKYLQQFQTHVVAIIARGLMFVSGALVAVMLVFTILDESILLYVRIFSEHDSIIFYISIFSAIFGISRSLVPSLEDVTGDPERIMHKCAAYTHHMPIAWRGRCNTYEVHAAFSELFQYKAEILFHEILACLCAPYILLVSLPSCADDIVKFVHQFTDRSRKASLGAVCVYSQFDFKRYGDPRYGCPRIGNPEEDDPNSRDRHYNRHVDGQIKAMFSPQWRCENGKMEKSFVNFKENHPEWHGGGDAGDWLLASLNKFSHSQHERRAQETMQQLSQSMGMGMSVGMGVGDSSMTLVSTAGGSGGAGGSEITAGSAGSAVASAAAAGSGGARVPLAPPPPPPPPTSQQAGHFDASAAAQSIMLANSLGASAFRMPALDQSSSGSGMLSRSGLQCMSQSSQSPSLALMETLTATAHENNFYWLQEYYANQVEEQQQVRVQHGRDHGRGGRSSLGGVVIDEVGEEGDGEGDDEGEGKSEGAGGENDDLTTPASSIEATSPLPDQAGYLPTTTSGAGQRRAEHRPLTDEDIFNDL